MSCCYTEPCLRRWVFSSSGCLFPPLTLQAWIISSYSAHLQPGAASLSSATAWARSLQLQHPLHAACLPLLVTENIIMLQINPSQKIFLHPFLAGFLPSPTWTKQENMSGYKWCQRWAWKEWLCPAWQTGPSSLLLQLLEALTRWTGCKYSSKKSTL